MVDYKSDTAVLQTKNIKPSEMGIQNAFSYIKAEQIEYFVTPGLLTKIIRKLVLATCNDISSISFPSDDCINLPEWDDRITYKGEEHIFMPKGELLWEMSCEKKIKSKADADFNKRTKDPIGQNIKQSTFVFVTSKIWTEKEKWISEKKIGASWKDIKVYDASDLELWLEKQIGATYREFYKGLSLLNERIFKFLDNDPNRWVGILDKLFIVPFPETQKKLLDKLLAVRLKSLEKNLHIKVWKNIIDKLCAIKEFNDADWNIGDILQKA